MALQVKGAGERAVHAAGALEIAALFRDYAELVERVLRRAGVQARDLPDARQEVFLVAHRRRADFEGQSRASTWLCGIALHVASDFRRKAYRRRECPDGFAQHEAAAVLGAASAPEQHEQLALALDALERVAPLQREVFVLFELLELPMSEVAARVGCPLKTAFSRLYAARRQLQVELRQRGLLAGFWPLFLPLGAQLFPRAKAAAAASTAPPWSALIAGAAACCLLAQGPAPHEGEAERVVRASPAAAAAASAVLVVEARPGSLPTVQQARAANSNAGGVRTMRPDRVRSANRKTAAARESLPAAEIAVVDESESEPELEVFRMSANEPAQPGEHPWASRLAPAPRAAPRLRLRGPADPAAAIEDALGRP